MTPGRYLRIDFAKSELPHLRSRHKLAGLTLPFAKIDPCKNCTSTTSGVFHCSNTFANMLKMPDGVKVIFERRRKSTGFSAVIQTDGKS
jgi:hypothetical protein